MRRISDISDEELLTLLKNGEHEFFTLAEAHKALSGAQIRTSIEEIRRRIALLFRDGYLGNEPTADGVNMYFIIYVPAAGNNLE